MSDYDFECGCGFEDDPICKCNGGPGYDDLGSSRRGSDASLKTILILMGCEILAAFIDVFLGVHLLELIGGIVIFFYIIFHL